MHQRLKYLSLFIFAFLFAYSINIININSIRKSNTSSGGLPVFSLIHEATINNIDNYWYLNHIKNYLKTGEFTYDTTSRLNAVRRTPLYPLYYGVHYLLFGEVGSYKAIKISQMLLYALSAVLLYIAVFRFTNNSKIAFITYLIYATFLPFVTYLSYTITEGVSPALNSIFLFSLSNIKVKNNLKNWFIAGIMFAILVLFRPNCIFIAGSVFFLLLYYSRFLMNNIIKSGLAFAFGSSLFFLPWMTHNYIKTNGEIILLEKYYGDQIGYGMPNMHLKYWIACWINPGDYSSEGVTNITNLKIQNNSQVEKDYFIDSLVNKIPDVVYIGNNKKDIRIAYSSLYDYYESKFHNVTTDSLLRIENYSISLFKKLKSDFIQNAPFHHYVLLPISYAKSMILQSNSSTIAFLEKYNESPLLYALKLFLYIFNILCYLALPLLLLFYKRYKGIFWMTLLYSLSTFLIIMYVNKNFEVRYTYAYFPMLFICVSIVIVELYEGFKSKYLKPKHN